MKTIHPAVFASLIAQHAHFDLIDVRSREEFDKTHIPGARSIPLPELRPNNFLHERKLPDAEPIYVICRSRALGGLASGELEGAGCANVVVVDGGMEMWQAQGLPVLRKRRFPEITLDLPMMAVIAGLALSLGLALHEVFSIVPPVIGILILAARFQSNAKRTAHRRSINQPAHDNVVEEWTIPHITAHALHANEDAFFVGHHHLPVARVH